MNNNITMSLGGQIYEGWEEIRVSRSIEQMSGQFSLTVSHLPEEWADFPMQESVILEVDGQILLSGFIDIIRAQYDADASYIMIDGRDAVGDLLDCAASVNGFEFNGWKLERAIAKILEPYKIPLTVNTDTGAPIKRLAVQVGETAFDFIERACRLRGVLAVSDGIGGLVLTKPSTDQAAGRLVLGENILSGDAEINWTQRFSDYIVKGQREADSGSDQDFGAGEDFGQEAVSEPEGRANDTAIKRYRPTVILSESGGFDLSTQARAAWQRSFNQSRSKTVTYKVAGFFATQDLLWLPNQIVNVVDPRLKINRDMLIISVEYSKNARGSITTLTLGLPEAFALPAEKEKAETADIWGENDVE